MTLREQVADLVIRYVNAQFLESAGLCRAADHMAIRAFLDGWARNSFDARVLLAWHHRLSTDGFVPEDSPGVEE